jgi:hypothetical protein
VFGEAALQLLDGKVALAADGGKGENRSGLSLCVVD